MKSAGLFALPTTVAKETVAFPRCDEVTVNVAETVAASPSVTVTSSIEIEGSAPRTGAAARGWAVDDNPKAGTHPRRRGGEHELRRRASLLPTIIMRRR